MEEPVHQAGKKKPAFAFWERQRKDSSPGPASAAQAAAATLSSASLSTPPSAQRAVSAQQPPGPTSGSALSGVQRLIQQYSQSNAPNASRSSSVTLDRSVSGQRAHASSPQSSRLASSGDPMRTSGRSDASRIGTSPEPSPSEQPLSESSGAIRVLPASSPPNARFSTGTVSSEASSSVPLPSHSHEHSVAASAPQIPHPRLSIDAGKEAETDKARRRRRLLQEQLRKRNSKRRSAGALEATGSPALSSDEQEDPAAVETTVASNHHLAMADVHDQADSGPIPARTPSSSSRRARLVSESDSNAPFGSGTESDPYHDARSQLVTPSKPNAAPLTADLASDGRQARGRPPSIEDTRPWLEFSPLLPEGELLEESPSKSSAPSFALLHQSASSDLSATASQSSATTDSVRTASLRPSPSRSNSASLLNHDSSFSSTAGLGFSTPPGYPAASSYFSMSSPTGSSHSRTHRTTKLPPPRPTPQVPLPPPPSVASSPSSFLPRTVATASSGGAATPARTVRSSSTRIAAPPRPQQDKGDVFGGHTLRSRSYSLEQEVASADQQDQRMASQPATAAGPAEAQWASAVHNPNATMVSTLAVPVIRQRRDSLQRKEREGVDVASRPAQAPSSSNNAVAAASSPRNSLVQPTIVGRPRGFTVGAVPGASSTSRSGGTLQAPLKSRPRSLLSNEILPLDLAEPRYKTKYNRDESDAVRKTYSMDIDRRVSSSGPAPSAKKSSAGAVLNRGLSASSASEREVNVSTERLGSDSTDRRPSAGGRSRSGSSASLLQQVNSQPKSHASFVIAVVGHAHSGKSTVIKKGLRQFGLSKPHVLSEKVTSHSTVCVVDQEQRTIEVLEIDASVLLNGPSKRFAWPKFLPQIDAVILCYDASEIASFRGMSELLENFAVANLSTVMLACKSEIHPKAVDPYYASDMACIYNVGLAECTVQSEEGKKRMRDCFSYLVKEVAKARSGRARRGPASTVPPVPATTASQQSQSPGVSYQTVPQSRTASSTSQTSSQANSLSYSTADTDALPGSSEQLPSLAAPIDLLRTRGYSNSSSGLGRQVTGTNDTLFDEALAPIASALERTTQATGTLPVASEQTAVSAQPRTAAVAGPDTRLNSRKMSSATTHSATSDAASFHSEEDGALHDSLHRAQMGLQNARSSGGYVSIEELWDKLFHAAISRTDERFVAMFMVFYRGFATPIDLLKQMMARFDTLTAEDVADGLVHRFALIRLTNMLGDWVLDYPGDLSQPETHALLVRYHRQLLRHPDTIHTAAQIQAAVDATAHATDLDALWSKTVNSDQTRNKGAGSAFATGSSSSRTGAEADGMGGLTASHSSSSMGGLVPSLGNTSNDFDGPSHSSGRSAEEDLHERTGSDSSLPVQSDLGVGNRSRSASDLTTSSTEGMPALYRDVKQTQAPSSGVSNVSGHTQSSGISAGGSLPMNSTATNASCSSSAANLGGVNDAVGGVSGNSRVLDQKTVLRSISNMLMEVDDEIIATELTRLEWGFFTAIQPRDLLRHILVPHDKRDGPVARSISHFNYISNWVCSMILAQGKTKHRARMLEKFFNIASILRHDNNYGSLNSVLGGLSKTAVHRLKHTRELLKGKAVNKAYQSLVRLMSNERSSAAYRLALENSDGPTIPYVGVHLQDILSISDGNPSKRASDGMIHWRKFSLMDEAVMAVVRCQQYDRYIKPNPAVERLIVEVPVMDDEALYERSLLVEPRQGGNGGIGAGASKIKDLKTFLSNQRDNAGGGIGASFQPLP